MVLEIKILYEYCYSIDYMLNCYDSVLLFEARIPNNIYVIVNARNVSFHSRAR